MKWLRKWIAIRQKIEVSEAFQRARFWSSGYVVAKNRVDILDAFIMIALPSYHYGYCPWFDDFRWTQNVLLYTRSKGWRLWQDLTVKYR